MKTKLRTIVARVEVCVPVDAGLDEQVLDDLICDALEGALDEAADHVAEGDGFEDCLGVAVTFPKKKRS